MGEKGRTQKGFRHGEGHEGESERRKNVTVDVEANRNICKITNRRGQQEGGQSLDLDKADYPEMSPG